MHLIHSGQVVLHRLPKWLRNFSPFLVIFLVSATTALSSIPSETCDQVAHQAAVESGVPVSVLQAITRTETGRRRNNRTQPWPWTVNMEGAGRWFDNPAEALSYVLEHFARGARSFDVGCFQINYRWHGQHFDSVEDMFDPLTNARYAARYLSELFAEKGNWDDAAGAYHSRTPRYANRYKERFRRFRTALTNSPPELSPPPREAIRASSPPTTPPQPAPQPRVNRYPLLQRATGAQSLGSLVALGGTGQTRSLLGSQN